jgi:putative SOS response-associated peptidase YedK
MCGRFGLTKPEKVDPKTIGADEWERITSLITGLVPRFNIAPSQDVAVVLDIVRAEGGRRVLTTARWGLVPHWAKDPSIGDRLINARADSVAVKPAYRAAFKRQRCLIPADVFYEWEDRGKGAPRQPYAIRRKDGEPFCFAGLWEEWRPKDEENAKGAEPLLTCAIITTVANGVMAAFHHRMPVIVAPADYGRWLDPQTPLAEVAALLRPAPDDWLEAYPVSPYVNDPRHDDARTLEPVA